MTIRKLERDSRETLKTVIKSGVFEDLSFNPGFSRRFLESIRVPPIEIKSQTLLLPKARLKPRFLPESSYNKMSASFVGN